MLAHWNNNPRVDMLRHLDTLFWLSQPIVALSSECYVRRGEATNTNFIVFGLIRPVLEPTIYHTRGEHANHYATDAVVQDMFLPVGSGWLTHRDHINYACAIVTMRFFFLLDILASMKGFLTGQNQILLDRVKLKKIKCLRQQIIDMYTHTKIHQNPL